MVTYQNGVMTEVNLFEEDKVMWDGAKHTIEIYEEDINISLFNLIT